MVLSRNNVAFVTAEVLGTAMLTMAILAVSRSAIGVPYFVAIGVGLTLAMLVSIFGRVASLHANPAVTFGLWTLRKVSSLRALIYIAAQFAGAALAYWLYNYLVATDIQNVAGSEFRWEVLVGELVGTVVFTMGVAAAVFNRYEGGRFAATIGGSLILGILFAGVVSNGILNPAAALGVQSWSKEYVIGPLLGSVIGMNLYVLLFADSRDLKAAYAPIGARSATAVKKPAAKKRPAKK